MTRRFTSWGAITNNAYVLPTGPKSGSTLVTIHPPVVIVNTSVGGANKICEVAEWWGNDFEPTQFATAGGPWWAMPQYAACIMNKGSNVAVNPTATQYAGFALSSLNATPPFAAPPATTASDPGICVRARSTDGQWELVQDDLSTQRADVLVGVNPFDLTNAVASRVEIYYVPATLIQVYIDGTLGIALSGAQVLLGQNPQNSPHTGMACFVTSGTNAAGSMSCVFSDMMADIIMPV